MYAEMTVHSYEISFFKFNLYELRNKHSKQYN